MITVPMSVATDNVSLQVGIGAAYSVVDGDPYEGEYTVTPSSTTQVLETNGKVMTGNLTVNPIPQNYGLVTWNGSVLTIS